jgi:hypothetical protein
MSVVFQQQTFLASDWGEALVANQTATVTQQFAFSITLTGTLALGDGLTLVEQNASHTTLTLSCTGLGSSGGFVLVDGAGNDFLFSNTSVSIGSQAEASVAGFQTYQAPCVAAGTLIETVQGAVLVEALSVGNGVRTLLGGSGRIVWIGKRAVNCALHPKPEMVWPVRIAVGAFGENVPVRDLWLSPDHAVYVDGILVPVKLLINGTSIAQMPVAEVTYYHVELPRHDVLLAEGLPVESYLDTNGRANFTNGGGLVALHPEFTPGIWEELGCARLVVAGPALEAARRGVNARAETMCPGHRFSAG